MGRERIIKEYTLVYKNGEEINTESENEAWEEYNNTDKKEIDQFYRKDWELIEGEYEEVYVEVFYG